MHHSVDTDDAPCVSLGGKFWPIPVLAAKQNKIIDPLILSLLPIFACWQTDKTAALATLGQVQYDALLEIAFQAVRYAHQDISREQFLDLPELIAAFSIIAQQTGVFAKTESEKQADSGEA